jgi:hypothetical protein
MHPKLLAVADKIVSLALSGNKCAAFGCFTPTLFALQAEVHRRFAADPRLHGKYVSVVCAHVTGDARSGIVDKPNGCIHADPNCMALVSTYKTGGEGLNLAPTIAHVLLFERWWNTAVQQQAIDRAHRIGALPNVPVEVHVFEYSASFDSAVVEIYHAPKQHSSDLILKGEQTDQRAGAQLDLKSSEKLIDNVIRKLGANPGSSTTLADELGLASPSAGFVPRGRGVQKKLPSVTKQLGGSARQALARGDFTQFIKKPTVVFVRGAY